jgi:hypothetical protein
VRQTAKIHFCAEDALLFLVSSNCILSNSLGELLPCRG